MLCILFVAVVVWGGWSADGHALTVQDLDPDQDWHVKAIHISGNDAFSEQTLLAELLTKQRPWYTP